ncbi:NAD-dependent protein deacylase [Thermoflexales bacterium]|nr:NAD-dependent protein deacylase [Thermoflexales bacterium]
MSMAEFSPDLISILRAAQHIAVLTGAGVSAESGIPTFRDAQVGLWAQYRPEDLATPEAFLRNPKLVWDWYAWRRGRVSQVQPNAGHYALAQMQQRVAQFSLLTQNVDGLHQRAGSVGVIELHGNITRVKCSREGIVIDRWEETGETPPRCPHCGAGLRPDVVWFGEMLPREALLAANAATNTCDVFFSIGTSSLVEPAASLGRVASHRGATVVEVNPTVTPLTTHATFSLQGPAGVILPALIKAVWPS